MKIQLLNPNGCSGTAPEIPAAHESDTPFESCWHMDRGYLKKIRIKPGFDLYLMNFEPGCRLGMASPAWPTGFGFKCFVSGAMKYQNSAVKKEMVMAGGSSRISYFPISRGSGQCLSKERVTAATISMAPAFLTTLLQDNPAGINQLAAKGPDRPFYHVLPNSPAMEATVMDIFNCRFHGSLKKIFMEGKALELITYQLDQLLTCPGTGRIPPREKEKIELARQILVQEMEQPPSFLSLARRVGLPHNRLSSGFKTVYGVPPFTLLRDIRLEKARSLLAGGNGNVTEIALDVGYASLSHFALAFRKKYGISPKQYQLQHGF